MNTVLEAAGHPAHPRDAYKYFVGDGVVKLVERSLPGQDWPGETIEQFVKAVREEYSRRWDATTEPYEGVPEMLDALSEMGIAKAVLSNKPHEYTIKCVDRFLADNGIDLIQGVTDECPPKPDPTGALGMSKNLGAEPGEIIYLGDTNTDMQTAVAAGFIPVGATWGFRTREELLEAGARPLVDRPSQLLELV